MLLCYICGFNNMVDETRWIYFKHHLLFNATKRFISTLCVYVMIFYNHMYTFYLKNNSRISQLNLTNNIVQSEWLVLDVYRWDYFCMNCMHTVWHFFVTSCTQHFKWLNNVYYWFKYIFVQVYTFLVRPFSINPESDCLKWKIQEKVVDHLIGIFQQKKAFKLQTI